MAYLEELLPEFRKGAKIRQTDWDKEVFISFYKDEIYWYDDGAWKNGKLASTKDLVSLFTFHKDNWELYQEPIDYDYIIENKCLCWFWCDDNDDKYLGTIRYINKNDELPFMNWERGYAKNCRPVLRHEVTFYEDKKDD